MQVVKIKFIERKPLQMYSVTIASWFLNKGCSNATNLFEFSNLMPDA